MERQGWPTRWLMTDERLGADLDRAIAAAAAAGAGVIVRHYRSGAAERLRIAARVRDEGALLGMARDVALAAACGAALVHNPEGPSGALAFSLSVHDEDEARAAAALTPALVFVSPVHPTRSHPEAATLGEAEALRLARLSGAPAIALGGMDDQKARALLASGFYGWAGIDGWLRT